MQQRQMVAGFSELKDILIRKYKIKEDRNSIRLYFTISGNELYLHNFKKHSQRVALAKIGLPGNKFYLQGDSFAKQLIEFALNEKKPAYFLNDAFKSCGFFRF